MAALTSSHPCPELCHTSLVSAKMMCPICYVEMEPDKDWKITHDSCGNSYCTDCLTSWASQSETEYIPASCPLCRDSLGFLINDTPEMTFVVRSLDELRQEVGDEVFESLPLADRCQLGAVPWEEIDLEHVSLSSVKGLNRHQTIRSVLYQADVSGRLLTMPNGAAPPNAIEWFDATCAVDGVAEAVDLAMDNTWVYGQVHESLEAQARAQAKRLLFRLSGAGVRYFEAWKFPEYGRHTTFYIPCIPLLRILGSITELRRRVAARRAWSEYSQTGMWLDSIYTADQLYDNFRVDTSDGRTGYLLDMLPQWYNLHGFAIWKTDDMDEDILYAVPRGRIQCVDLPLKELGSLFIGDNGPENLDDEEIDFNDMPSGMAELWVDLFSP